MADSKHGSFYYPQAAISLHLRFEDFGDKKDLSKQDWFPVKCLARNVTVKMNGYRQADTFSIEIDYKYFPFDPRAIRACHVLISIQDMGSLFNDDNSLKRLTIDRSNSVFMGFADEESISFDDERRTVRLEGRDYTSLLIDRKFLEGNIAVDKPLDQVLRQLLGQLEETKDMAIDIRYDGELPVLATFWSDKGELSGKKNVKKDQSYWDVIQGLVSDAALIAYVELDTLVITKPQILFGKRQAKKFVYGRNIKNLEFKRKIGRKKGFNIAVRCLNVETKEVLEALIPKEATDEWSRETGIPNMEVIIPKMVPVSQTPQGQQENQLSSQEAEQKGEPAPYIAFSVKNITSKAQLIEVGQSIYEEMGRQQIEGSFETREMKIAFTPRNGTPEIFDILKLRIGMPVSIDIDIKDAEQISKMRDMSGIESYLVKHQFNSKVARYLSEALAKADVPFYTKSIEFTMDSENGFDCKVDFLNFIETKHPAFKDVK